MPKVIVYGADWCPLTRRAIEYLERIRVPFSYVDVEADPEASKWVKNQNGGKEKKPTIDIDGRILSEPTNEELRAALS
jgi:mycoredoxin